jgi:two-component system sensor histidine kinase UhpB
MGDIDLTQSARVRFRRAAAKVFPSAELAWTGLYLLLGMLWSVYSDQYINVWLAGEDSFPARVTAKGVNFVLTTGAVLYLVLRRAYTERRAAEFVSRENFERYELVARASSDAMWDWDLRNNRVWRSDGWGKLFGYVRGELDAVIESWIDRLHPEDQERVVTSLRQAARSRRQLWVEQYRFRARDGRYVDVEDRAYVMRDGAGEPIRVIGGMSDISERKRAEEELRVSGERLRALSGRLETLREEERTRISREIHDELGQLLTGLKMELRWVEDRLTTGAGCDEANLMLERLVEAVDLVDQVMESVRRIAAELRPDMLDSLGLLNALQFELDRFRKLAGAEVVVELPEDLEVLPPAVRTGVFRIFQEALTNVARHAGCKRVEVTLRVAGGRARLQIRDDGVGMAMAEIGGLRSLGILGMQERAKLLGAELRFESAPGEGMSVVLDFPLQPVTECVG